MAKFLLFTIFHIEHSTLVNNTHYKVFMLTQIYCIKPQLILANEEPIILLVMSKWNQLRTHMHTPYLIARFFF